MQAGKHGDRIPLPLQADSGCRDGIRPAHNGAAGIDGHGDIAGVLGEKCERDNAGGVRPAKGALEAESWPEVPHDRVACGINATAVDTQRLRGGEEDLRNAADIPHDQVTIARNGPGDARPQVGERVLGRCGMRRQAG